MAKEKTTVKGLSKAIQSLHDKFDLRLKNIEEKAKVAERQRTCDHTHIKVEVSNTGSVNDVKCGDCGIVFLDTCIFRTPRELRRTLIKFHGWLKKQSQ